MLTLRFTRPGVPGLILASILLVSALPARAAIIPQSGYFVDTDTGLDWRDVTLTRGMSYNAVEAELAPGGSLEGWRRATGTEFSQLMNDLNVPYKDGSCQPDYCDRYGTDEPAEITAAIVLLGDIYGDWATDTGNDKVPAPGEAGYTTGMLADRNGVYVKTAMVMDADYMAAHNGYLYDPGEDKVFTHCVDTPLACGGIGDTLPTASVAQLGTYLVRDTAWTPNEICDNGIDDDLDGLVDGDDPDCYEPVGLLVRCTHEPLWPAIGETVTLHAEAIDANGEPVQADRIELYYARSETPVGGASGQAEKQLQVVAENERTSYKCRAELGPETASSGWREVDVGTPELTGMRAVPVIYNGPMAKKLDIVFLPEADRHPLGAQDPQFSADVYRAIHEGIYGIPWFVRHQREINFWVGQDKADVYYDIGDPFNLCRKLKPLNFMWYYGFADAAGILHGADCRDNASLKVFSTRFVDWRLQVVSHEIGHAAFTLSDEYVSSSSLYFTLPDYPNLLPTENKCRSAAVDRGFNPDDCRSLQASGASGFLLGGNWIFEPDYRNPDEPWNATRDLMQQTGGDEECFTDAGDSVSCHQRYGVGPSETARMQWKMNKCAKGRC
jgi:hypothetical protein